MLLRSRPGVDLLDLAVLCHEHEVGAAVLGRLPDETGIRGGVRSDRFDAVLRREDEGSCHVHGLFPRRLREWVTDAVAGA